MLIIFAFNILCCVMAHVIVVISEVSVNRLFKFTENLAVTFLLYNNLEELMNPVSEPDSPVVVTKVISAAVNKHTYPKAPTLSYDRRQLKRPMNFTLTHSRVCKI